MLIGKVNDVDGGKQHLQVTKEMLGSLLVQMHGKILQHIETAHRAQ